MSAFLPKQDSLAGRLERTAELMMNRALYQYDYTHIAPLAVAKDLQITDQFSFDWLSLVGRRILDGFANRVVLEEGVESQARIHEYIERLEDLLSLGTVSIIDVTEQLAAAFRFGGRVGASKDHARTIQEYADMFREIGLPPISAEFREDRVFAAMRVAGPNPVVLEQVKALDGRLPIDSAMFQLAVAHNLPGSTDTLEAALREGRLYLADYALLDGAELGTLPNGQKYLYAPLALFVVTGPAKELLPVAIQCRQEPAPDNPVFTPNDGYNWLIAKTIVETADGNLHEASTHLGRTHLAMEAFLLASYRQLSWRHPLRVLLGPHFEGTLAINEMAWKFLVSEGGAVDYLMAGTIQTSRKVAAAGLQSLNIMDDRLPLTFSKRGVADSTLFPNYPYRDDSLLYWNAIHQWVSDYVQLYYLSDTDVAEDDELKAWGREIVAPDGGRLRGIPNGGSIQTVGELIDVLTFVIYTCSVQHAAVNFPQYDCMSYVPNMPLAGYRPAPTSKTGATEADFVAMLPTLDMAELQMEVTYLLGSVHYTQLGQYGDNHFEDARVAEPLRSFQQRLKQIDATIKDRNSSRRPYATLAASGIPQSINI